MNERKLTEEQFKSLMKKEPVSGTANKCESNEKEKVEAKQQAQQKPNKPVSKLESKKQAPTVKKCHLCGNDFFGE